MPPANSSEVPETYAPPFEIGDGVHWVTPTGLTRMKGPAEGFVIIGAGKTGMDSCVWLLEQGVAPGDIRWVRAAQRHSAQHDQGRRS